MSAKTPSIPTLTDAQSREHWVESRLRAVPRSREAVEGNRVSVPSNGERPDGREAL